MEFIDFIERRLKVVVIILYMMKNKIIGLMIISIVYYSSNKIGKEIYNAKIECNKFNLK